MEWINIVSNNDSVVSNLTIIDDSINIYIELWDGNKKVVQFTNYKAFKEKKSIGEEIGDIVIQEQSQLLEEVKLDIVGEEDSLGEMKTYIFKDAWNNKIILEILAESVKMY